LRIKKNTFLKKNKNLPIETIGLAVVVGVDFDSVINKKKSYNNRSLL
jgi:hypothetical protein